MGDLPDGLTRCIASSVVSVMVMIATALAAAVLYGAGAAVEQRQAGGAPGGVGGRALVAAGNRRADRRVRGACGRAAVGSAGDRADAGVGGARRRGGDRAHLVRPSAEPGLLGRG